MNPLQVPPELLVIGVVALILIGISIGLTYWVYTDATRRGNDNAVLWAVVVFVSSALSFLGGLVVVGIYILTRE